MRLKKLTDFHRENIVSNEKGKKPSLETLKRWPGVKKLNGEYYMDLDVHEDCQYLAARIERLEDDPVVAEMTG